MADTTMETEAGRETAVGGLGGVIAGAPIRIRWSAIFAGAVAALGIWALLYALGLALGLSLGAPGEVPGAFAGIWSVLAPLVALFLGGFVASRGSGVMTRGGGGMHGLVVWALTTLVGAWFLGVMGFAMGGLGPILAGGGMDPEAAAVMTDIDPRLLAWGIFGGLLLGLLSAIFGGLLGVSRRQRAWADAPPVSGAAPVVPPVGHREVYSS